MFRLLVALFYFFSPLFLFVCAVRIVELMMAVEVHPYVR